MLTAQLDALDGDPGVVLGDEDPVYPGEEELLAVPKDEFEKDYEVK